jgi:hemerythrin
MTKFVEWSDVLSVGIEEIDAQHRVLVDLVNQMHEAIHQHKGTAAVNEILGKLADYTRIHFAVEESLMRILGYPEYEEHKAEHEELLHTVADLQHKVETGKTSIGFELMHFLKVWLTKHIMESDQRYSEHFITAGAHSKLKKKSWAARLWEGLHG